MYNIKSLDATPCLWIHFKLDKIFRFWDYLLQKILAAMLAILTWHSANNYHNITIPKFDFAAEYKHRWRDHNVGRRRGVEADFFKLRQGDQIGRIFAIWVIFYFEQFCLKVTI
jgi:hypothetical protein